MRYDDERGWPERMDWRARVLVENADAGVGFAMQRLLKDAAFAVECCGGPDHLRKHRCPLVEGGRCALVEGADVIVHSLNPDRADQAAVLRAIRELHPQTPVVVEVPRPAMEAHAALLEGCTIVPMPATRATITDAVRRALSGV
jgi:DNA-binding NtrC family response regulator